MDLGSALRFDPRPVWVPFLTSVSNDPYGESAILGIASAGTSPGHVWRVKLCSPTGRVPDFTGEAKWLAREKRLTASAWSRCPPTSSGVLKLSDHSNISVSAMI